MLPEETTSLVAVKSDEGAAPDVVESLIGWWHEHANLCIVAATVPSHDIETRETILRQLDESMARGEAMLRAVLLDTPNVRRPAVVMRDNDPYRAFPNASGLMPASGMNRFDERMTGASRLMRPIATMENQPKELQPSRTYIKKKA